MKKSFGVRTSQQPSLLESIAGRSSIIPNRKTFFGQIATSQPDNTAVVVVPRPVEPKPVAAVMPTEGKSASAVEKEVVVEKKEKDDTITIIDTELHLGEQRLKTKFTTDSQWIFDALNSLKLKSTPGQGLQERVVEMETPAPVRNAEKLGIDGDEEEDWIPKKDVASLVERLFNENPVSEMKEIERVPDQVEPMIEIRQVEMPPPVVMEKRTEPAPTADSVAPILPTSTSTPTSAKFESAAAQAVEVIRNAMAIITNDPKPSTPKQLPTTNIYPNLDDEPMADIQPSENFTIHYDDRTSLDSNHDSAYFTQSDVPTQPSQADPEPTPPVPQPVPPPQTQPPAPRTAAVKPKPVPVSIRVPTASQRQKERAAKMALTQVPMPTTGIYPTLTQSRSVPDLATPAKMARDEARASNVSVQSMGGFVRGGGIKALNAAKLAKQRVHAATNAT
jgi:hypothetical protein